MAGQDKIAVPFLQKLCSGIRWRGPTAVSSLGMPELVFQTTDSLAVFPQRLCCSHNFGTCSRTALEDSRAQTTSTGSFGGRAKLLSWVAVTAHELSTFAGGWT